MATKLSQNDFEKFSFSKLNSSERIDFCKTWPTAKDFLNFLKEKMNNPLIKAAIEIIIKQGDKYFKNNCPVPNIARKKTSK